MNSTDALYAELKPQMALVAGPLFELSETLLRSQGNFLPHAVVLTDGGEIKLVGAAAASDLTNSVEILPILHDGLRQQARELPLQAIGVAENVTSRSRGSVQPRPSRCSSSTSVALLLRFTFLSRKSCFVGTSWAPPFRNWLHRKSMRGLPMPSNSSVVVVTTPILHPLPSEPNSLHTATDHISPLHHVHHAST